MITLYCGTPGSGKSLYAAGQILDALSQKKLVITNYPLSFDHIKGKIFQWYYGAGVRCEVSNDDLSPQFCQIAAHSFFAGDEPKEGRILLVIDEAGLVFNPRDWNRPDRKDWLTFLSQHRKLGFDVILIAQSDNQLDKQLRPLLEYRVRFKRVSSLLGFPCSIFVGVRSYYNSRSRSDVLSTTVFRYHKRWAKLYQTMRIF